MTKLVQTKVGELMNFQRGYDLPKSDFINGPYPVRSSNGLLGFHNEFKAKAPGITIGRSGTVGIPHFINDNFFPHNTTLFINDFKGNNEKYIYYLLISLKLNEWKSGSGVPTLNRNHLHPIDIKAYLDYETQKQIAKVLSDLDAKIEVNNKINQELEAMAKTLYDYWFVQFDFPAHLSGTLNGDEGYKTSGGKMVFNEELKREIPEGWENGSLLNIANFQNGLACQKYRPINDTFLPVIKIREMREGFTDNTEKVRKDVPDRIKIFDGDILFSWSASLDVIIWTGGNGALNQHIFKVTSDDYPKSYYYFELLNYLEHFKMIADLRKTTMGHITQDHLKQSRITIPPMNICKELERKIDPILKTVVSNQQQNRKLSELRDWLLPMLMNGQVTVNSLK